MRLIFAGVKWLVPLLRTSRHGVGLPSLCLAHASNQDYLLFHKKLQDFRRLWIDGFKSLHEYILTRIKCKPQRV